MKRGSRPRRPRADRAKSRGSTARSKRATKLLAGLLPEEAARVLQLLLERRPELAPDVEEIARATLTSADIETIAQDAAQAVLALDLDDLGGRAGRTSGGYVGPTEAAWELLGEALDPLLGDVERHIELGLEAPAVATCAGIVLGLYRCQQDERTDRLLGWAPDFPAETAAQVVETLARESVARHRRTWRVPAAVLDQVPEWQEMIARSARPPRARH